MEIVGYVVRIDPNHGMQLSDPGDDTHINFTRKTTNDMD